MPIGGNGTYTANLSNTANGTLTYLMTVSDPAGNVINVGSDGDSGRWFGECTDWTRTASKSVEWLRGTAIVTMVAGVDYAVVSPSGTSLTPWYSLSGPGISVNTSTHVVTVTNTSRSQYNWR